MLGLQVQMYAMELLTLQIFIYLFLITLQTFKNSVNDNLSQIFCCNCEKGIQKEVSESSLALSSLDVKTEYI